MLRHRQGNFLLDTALALIDGHPCLFVIAYKVEAPLAFSAWVLRIFFH